MTEGTFHHICPTCSAGWFQDWIQFFELPDQYIECDVCLTFREMIMAELWDEYSGRVQAREIIRQIAIKDAPLLRALSVRDDLKEEYEAMYGVKPLPSKERFRALCCGSILGPPWIYYEIQWCECKRSSCKMTEYWAHSVGKLEKVKDEN